MDHVYEVRSLASETLAVQAIFIGVLDRLAKSISDLRTAIAAGFDDAANYVELVAIKLGAAAAPEHTVKALQIVEGMRATTLGKPKQSGGAAIITPAVSSAQPPMASESACLRGTN